MNPVSFPGDPMADNQFQENLDSRFDWKNPATIVLEPSILMSSKVTARDISFKLRVLSFHSQLLSLCFRMT